MQPRCGSSLGDEEYFEDVEVIKDLAKLDRGSSGGIKIVI